MRINLHLLLLILNGSAAYDRDMTSYLLIVALIAGLLMYLLSSNTKVARIGEMILFSSILALLIALAPATVAKLG